ncbi:hypothetical protein LS482_11245 [Sinomicrobium kalidii]|uniref:hypothetical protein n=1 Tax=Sinomicrobium kalidii TaxID=2900738 RepID=UPI001E50EAFA|nr:hypothetical protein [Sinomicrobium kalidii]UGU14287.1 hypothetical protein LS482_11245 [Sinomicrobium kalidii]
MAEQLKAETGAEAEIYLATAPEVQGVTGKYFDRKEEAKANSRAYDVTARRPLWEVSNKYVGM